MADQITFQIPTKNICREISNQHHLRFVISDPLYRSKPAIQISKFSQPKEHMMLRVMVSAPIMPFVIQFQALK